VRHSDEQLPPVVTCFEDWPLPQSRRKGAFDHWQRGTFIEAEVSKENHAIVPDSGTQMSGHHGHTNPGTRHFKRDHLISFGNS
jgi:hypothetical protein